PRPDGAEHLGRDWDGPHRRSRDSSDPVAAAAVRSDDRPRVRCDGRRADGALARNPSRHTARVLDRRRSHRGDGRDGLAGDALYPGAAVPGAGRRRYFTVTQYGLTKLLAR